MGEEREDSFQRRTVILSEAKDLWLLVFSSFPCLGRRSLQGYLRCSPGSLRSIPRANTALPSPQLGNKRQIIYHATITTLTKEPELITRGGKAVSIILPIKQYEALLE